MLIWLSDDTIVEGQRLALPRAANMHSEIVENTSAFLLKKSEQFSVLVAIERSFITAASKDHRDAPAF